MVAFADKTILSLCEISGEASKPYRDAGYDVQAIDIQSGQDIRLLKHPGRAHGVMAFPPCTHFSRAGAWKWKEKGEAALLEGLAVVDACLRVVATTRPQWWFLENPIGRLKDYLGEPQYKFDPCDFGDPWTKRTWLWGHFAPPLPIADQSTFSVEPTLGDVTTKGSNNKNRRSKTSSGFALARFSMRIREASYADETREVSCRLAIYRLSHQRGSRLEVRGLRQAMSPAGRAV